MRRNGIPNDDDGVNGLHIDGRHWKVYVKCKITVHVCCIYAHESRMISPHDYAVISSDTRICSSLTSKLHIPKSLSR
jgi:hypothetical protein